MRKKPYVVVLMTSRPCEEYPGTRCVMEARGPFTRAKAEAVMDKLLSESPWTAPHCVFIKDENGA